jgi:hypothetical protein
MRDLGLEYERAVAAVFIAKLLGAATPELREAIDEAEATLRRLGAAPMLERLTEARLAGGRGDAGASAGPSPADGGATAPLSGRVGSG